MGNIPHKMANTDIRISPETISFLRLNKALTGISQTAYVELAIKEKREREGTTDLKVPKIKKTTAKK